VGKGGLFFRELGDLLKDFSFDAFSFSFIAEMVDVY
jgi:hypothetical protein